MKRPNILLITSDQHRADALGVGGHPVVQTPHLDLIARQGTRFANAYVDCPVCIPARTALITGRRAYQNGMPEYGADFRIDRRREDLLGGLITAAGYQTELVGKTHWHTEPTCRGGFEHVTWLARLREQQLIETGRSGMLVGIGYNEQTPTLSPFPRHLHTTDWIVDKAVDFLTTRERDQPFFLWVSMQDPHPPLIIHEPYYSMYAKADIPAPVVPAWVGTDAEPWEHYVPRNSWYKGNPALRGELLRHAASVYFGMVTNLDHQIGRLLAQLQMDGDEQDTLIVYSSDHGEMLGDYGDIGKRSFLASSAKVPLLLRPPPAWGVEPGRTVEQVVEWADLLPTLCDAAGARIPGDVTGRSLLPLARGESLEAKTLHGQIGGSHLLHDGLHKYLYSTLDGSELCFDAAADPLDERPLEGEMVGRMRQALIEYLAAENHPHLIDGELLNERRERPPIAELLAKNDGGMGATQYLANAAADVIHIH